MSTNIAFFISYIKTNCFSWYFRLKTWYLTLFITSDPSLVPVLDLECNKSMFPAMSCSWFYSNFSNKSVPDCYCFLNSNVPWVRKNRTIWEVLVHSSGSTCSILLWWQIILRFLKHHNPIDISITTMTVCWKRQKWRYVVCMIICFTGAQSRFDFLKSCLKHQNPIDSISLLWPFVGKGRGGDMWSAW